jgi:hypothetical protein
MKSPATVLSKTEATALTTNSLKVISSSIKIEQKSTVTLKPQQTTLNSANPNNINKKAG